MPQRPTTFAHSAGGEPRTWHLEEIVNVDEQVIGLAVRVSCPGCGVSYDLAHEIDDNGVVAPSLECQTKNCTFHNQVILTDYAAITGLTPAAEVLH